MMPVAFHYKDRCGQRDGRTDSVMAERTTWILATRWKEGELIDYDYVDVV